MKPKDTRKKRLVALFRQGRSEAQRRLVEATGQLERAEEALSEIGAKARRLERDLQAPGWTGAVKAGSLGIAALGRERTRAQRAAIEAERRSVAEALGRMRLEVDAAKEAVARAQRALDGLDPDPA